MQAAVHLWTSVHGERKACLLQSNMRGNLISFAALCMGHFPPNRLYIELFSLYASLTRVYSTLLCNYLLTHCHSTWFRVDIEGLFRIVILYQTGTSFLKWINSSRCQLCWHLEATLTSQCPRRIRKASSRLVMLTSAVSFFSAVSVFRLWCW